MAKEKTGSNAILRVEDLNLAFAGLQILNNVSFSVEEHSIFSIIGPNGAGKTSLFNCISGLYKPQGGLITFFDQEISQKKPEAIAPLGIGRMFQNIALFENLTVLDNLYIGRHHLTKYKWWQGVLRSKEMLQEDIVHREKIEEIIDLLELQKFRKMPISILPYGVLKRVELGRALATEPKLLLLDEPAAGLNQEETEDMARYVMSIYEKLKLTQILIEHDLKFVMDLSDEILALNFGQIIAHDVPAKIKNHTEVVRAYVGSL